MEKKFYNYFDQIKTKSFRESDKVLEKRKQKLDHSATQHRQYAESLKTRLEKKWTGQQADAEEDYIETNLPDLIAGSWKLGRKNGNGHMFLPWYYEFCFLPTSERGGVFLMQKRGEKLLAKPGIPEEGTTGNTNLMKFLNLGLPEEVQWKRDEYNTDQIVLNDYEVTGNRFTYPDVINLQSKYDRPWNLQRSELYEHLFLDSYSYILMGRYEVSGTSKIYFEQEYALDMEPFIDYTVVYEGKRPRQVNGNKVKYQQYRIDDVIPRYSLKVQDLEDRHSEKYPSPHLLYAGYTDWLLDFDGPEYEFTVRIKEPDN